MNAQQTTEVVVLQPGALTLWAASPVAVYLDTAEMDSAAQVSQMASHSTIPFCN